MGEFGIRLLGLGLTEIDVGGGAVEGNPVAFLDDDVFRTDLHGELFLVLLDVQLAGADHAGQSHAARDYGGVARLAADRGEHALGDFHAVDVVGSCFLADQDDRTAAGFLDSFFGGEDRATDRCAGRCVDAVGDLG